MRGGFEDSRWRGIADAVRSVKPVDRMVIFGSRAKGNWREGSDVDLAVWGSTWDDFDAERARAILEERFFPWSFDVVLPEKTSNADLLSHIERLGFSIETD